MPHRARVAAPVVRPGAPADPAATWAAALVATVRQDEASVGAKPAQVARRMVGFGVETTLRAMLAIGEDAPVTPETLTVLVTVREWVASPRRKASLRKRLAVMTEGEKVTRSNPTPASLLAGAAAYLAAATSDGNVDETERLVASALACLTRAVGGEVVGRVFMEGMADALALEPVRRKTRRRRS